MKLSKKEFNNTHGEKILTTDLLDIIAEIIAGDILKKIEVENGGSGCQKI